MLNNQNISRKLIQIMAVGVITLITTTGCSTKHAMYTDCIGCTPVSDDGRAEEALIKNANNSRQSTADSVSDKAPQMKIRPIIGTRSNDSKIVRDFGIIQKIWIKTYSDPKDNLIGAHDIYAVIKQPKWVLGEKLPTQKKTGLTSPTNYFPTSLRNEELDSYDEINEETVKKFMNNLNVTDQQPKDTVNRIESVDTKHNEGIMGFLKNRKPTSTSKE